MDPSYLSENDIMQWAPWFWALVAYKWTADQGVTVPLFLPTWRAHPSCNLADHIHTLIGLWLPDSTDLTVEDDADHGWYLAQWRDPRLNAWRAALRTAPPTARRDLLRQYAAWLRTIRAILQAQVRQTPWLSLALRKDTWTWQFDPGHSDGFWDDSPLLDLAHWLQTLAQQRATIPLPRSEVMPCRPSLL